MPNRLRYEVRDPIHGFVSFDPLERAILDTRPVQRLRNIKQLALTNQLYPGATHSRLEHSLGVMELAGRALDTVHAHAGSDIRDLMGWHDPAQLQKDRQLLRLAALLHDIGHTPLSHAAEALVPDAFGTHHKHEWVTRALLEDPQGEIAQVLEAEMRRQNVFGVRPGDLLPLAVEHEVAEPRDFREALLPSLLSGPLGVDRVDYLVRD